MAIGRKTPQTLDEQIETPQDLSSLTAMLGALITSTSQLAANVAALATKVHEVRSEQVEIIGQITDLTRQVLASENAILDHKPVNTSAMAVAVQNQDRRLGELAQAIQAVQQVSHQQAAYIDRLAPRLGGIEEIVRSFTPHSAEQAAHATSALVDRALQDTNMRITRLGEQISSVERNLTARLVAA